MKIITVTVHKTSEGSVHCWFNTDDVPMVVEDEIETIESEVFTEERDNDAGLFDNLPAEGSYDHEPITVGTVSYTEDGIEKINVKLDGVREQLEYHNYL